MKNAEWMIKKGMKFSKLSWGYINGRNIVDYCKDNRNVNELYAEKAANPENLITKWLDMDYKEPILDDEEKRYLKGVIRPFRDKVVFIMKRSAYDTEKEYISIRFAISDETSDETYLPCFKKGTMYKGMKADKSYMLKELGL